MNVLIDGKNASCVVKCPWLNLERRKDKYARVEVFDRSRKRQLGQHSRSKWSCLVRATVWTPASHPSGATSKAFRRESTSECLISGWGGSCSILAINDAIDSNLFVTFTWILMGLKRKDGATGLALLRFTENGIQLHSTRNTDDSPVQGVVLQGPHMLYSTVSGVAVEGPDAACPLVGSSRDLDSSATATSLIATAERDSEGFVLTHDPNVMKTEALMFSSFRAPNFICERLWTGAYSGKSIQAIAISFRRGILVVADEHCAVRALDIKSGGQLWEAIGGKSMRPPYTMVFFRNELLAGVQGTEGLWYLSLNPDRKVSTARRLKPMFPEQCPSTSTQAHNHFLAPWRGYLLQCSNENGTHCADHELSSQVSPMMQGQANAAPFMLSVSRNLERRLDVGVQQVTETAQKKEDKTRIVAHIRSLLANAAGNPLGYSHRKLFSDRLERIVELPERRRPVSELFPLQGESDLEKQSPAGDIVVNGQALPEGYSRFVRLLHSTTGIDKTGRFIAIRVHLSLLDTEDHNEDSPAPVTALWLNVKFDMPVSAVWDIQRTRGLPPGNSTWLEACAPISSVVSNSDSRLMNLSVIVRVDAEDGRSQLLGEFTVPSILAHDAQSDIAASGGGQCNLMNFQRRIQAVAQGVSAPLLLQLSQPQLFPGGFRVKIREHLALVEFSVASKTELVLQVAKLQARAPDDVKLRRAVDPSRPSLRGVDMCLLGLEKEMHLIRRIGTQHSEIGYDVSRIITLLECQLAVDDSFGCLEEQFVGS